MHIAMWTCARSRSTLLLRAFQQHKKCITLDEPLYAPYLASAGFDHPDREAIINNHETDYAKVTQQMTGALPTGMDFSFQKHTANNVRLDADLSWLKELKSFFLIRSPKEIISSRYAIYQTQKYFTLHEIGLEDLYNLFTQVKDITGETPVVVDSTDILKSPLKMLLLLSERLGFQFTDNMMSWPPGLRETDPIWAKTWYQTLLSSSGFMPYVEKNAELPAHLQTLYTACLPFYDALYAQRLTPTEGLK